jgi:hypothetical protein
MLNQHKRLPAKGSLSRRETIVAAAVEATTTTDRGAEKQLQRVVWDPGGFQQPGWRAHEQELMNFHSRGV